MAEHILVVDDKDGIRTFIQDVLETAGYIVTCARDGRQAARLLEKERFDLTITDLMMPELDGIGLLKIARTIAPDMAVILLTAHGTVESAVTAMKIGAFDYLTKPLSGPEALRQVVSRALEHRRFIVEKPKQNSFGNMVAEDPKMKAVSALIAKVAVTDAAVLLHGESGTGKEVAAQRIHQLSKRSDRPFVAVNCAAISDTLIESEMFGHEKGAFTGASEQRIGRFEQADSGTLFLDEVGELPLPLQAKLLRVLQEQRFERVGGNHTVSVNVRIVAATNRNLADEIQKGRFREDLFHRLSVFPIELPPLRNRPADLLPLVNYLLEGIGTRLGKSAPVLTKEALSAVRAHLWPGNVRELGNTLERAAILTDTTFIEKHHLLLQEIAMVPKAEPLEDGVASLREVEKEAVRAALLAVDGHRKNAADRLGISLRSLYNKLKEYGLD